MTVSVTALESLRGRPAAWVHLLDSLLAVHPQHRQGDALSLRRWGRLDVDRSGRTAWWMWPWAAEDRHQPWAIPDGRAREQLQRWLRKRTSSSDTEPELRMLVPRPVGDPSWAERVRAHMLEGAPHGLRLKVHVHGPEEILGWTHDIEQVLRLDVLRAHRVLTAQLSERTACERALISALDEGRPDVRELWRVVADELQVRGDPTGESLALALAQNPERPSLDRTISNEYSEREAKRMAVAPRHMRMLAFVDQRGASFPAESFLPDGHAPIEPGLRHVHLWAECVGPFFVRVLAASDDRLCRGLGLPEVLFEAPQLRYLSPARLASIDPDCADISQRDLSGFALAQVPAYADSVSAYEARLRGCDLSRADLSNWRLDGADLRDAAADLETRFGQASFDDTRVSPQLRRMLDSWNAGRYRRIRGSPGAPASVQRIEVVASEP